VRGILDDLPQRRSQRENRQDGHVGRDAAHNSATLAQVRARTIAWGHVRPTRRRRSIEGTGRVHPTYGDRGVAAPFAVFMSSWLGSSTRC
jgi:hypothetical protein